MERDTEGWDLGSAYHFLTAAVAPRPIAWVTTVNVHGLVNAAPFSWFNAVCADPPMLMLAIQERSPGVPKDTLRNLRDTGEFVVNVATLDAAPAMVASSGDYPPDVSEVTALGLATAPSVRVRPPRLAASPVHFECRLDRILPLGRTGATSLVLGKVVHVGARDDVLDARGNLDPAKCTLVARLGGPDYIAARDVFQLRRPHL